MSIYLIIVIVLLIITVGVTAFYFIIKKFMARIGVTGERKYSMEQEENRGYADLERESHNGSVNSNLTE